MTLILDHLAVAATSLDAATAWVEAQLGVTLQPGGQHPLYGTYNRLLGLDDGLYLEVIAKEPGAVAQAGYAWFGLDSFTGPPRLANWICQSDDLVADIQKAPLSAGHPRALTRGDLSWQITVPDGGALPFGAAFPTMITWEAGTRHPSERLPHSGCRLHQLEISHPEMPMLQSMMALADPRVRLVKGAFRLGATFETPLGIRVLS